MAAFGALRFTLRIPHINETKSVSIPESIALFYASWRMPDQFHEEAYDYDKIRPSIRKDLVESLHEMYEHGLHNKESFKRFSDGIDSTFFQSKLLTIIERTIQSN